MFPQSHSARVTGNGASVLVGHPALSTYTCTKVSVLIRKPGGFPELFVGSHALGTGYFAGYYESYDSIFKKRNSGIHLPTAAD